MAYYIELTACTANVLHINRRISQMIETILVQHIYNITGGNYRKNTDRWYIKFPAGAKNMLKDLRYFLTWGCAYDEAFETTQRADPCAHNHLIRAGGHECAEARPL